MKGPLDLLPEGAAPQHKAARPVKGAAHARGPALSTKPSQDRPIGVLGSKFKGSRRNSRRWTRRPFSDSAIVAGVAVVNMLSQEHRALSKAECDPADNSWTKWRARRDFELLTPDL